MTEENKDLQVSEKDNMIGGGGFSLAPCNLGEAMEFAKMMANTDMIPKDYRGKPANIMVAVQMGAEIGLKPLQSLQNIAVINGRPSVWGDSLIALVLANPLCEGVTEYFLNKKGEKTVGEDYETAVCVVKRKGQDKETRTFSFADAAKAGLKGKAGPWSQYTKRMLQMRARGFALRDVFPDILKGLQVAEEAQDMPPRDITPSKSETTITPEFDVPGIDTDRSVMVDDDSKVIDVKPGDVETEPEVVKEGTPEESPFEDEEKGEVVVVTAKDLIDRIKTMANTFEHKNWMPKHLNEINALSADDQAAVLKAYAEKGEEINDSTPDNALSEDGYKALMDAAGSKGDLDDLWFNRVEKEVTDSKVKIRLRSFMNKKAGDFDSGN
jgi:hypothetical protein